MRFDATVPSQITVAGETNFDASTGTIMFWMRSSGLASPGGNPATLFDRLSNAGAALVQNNDGTLAFEPKSGGIFQGIVISTNTIADDHWHHVALVYDRSTSGPLNGGMIFYIDGQPDNTGNVIGNWSWPAGQEIELGLSHDTSSWQAYNGQLDDVRFYSRILTGTEIASAKTGALVDTSALVMQLDFTAAPSSGITLEWQCPDGILQSAASITGPWTDLLGAASPYNVSTQPAVKFYRYRGHVPQVVISNPYLM